MPLAKIFVNSRNFDGTGKLDPSFYRRVIQFYTGIARITSGYGPIQMLFPQTRHRFLAQHWERFNENSVQDGRPISSKRKEKKN